MVTSCSAFNCTERFKQESKMSFHRFPMNNEQLLRIWCIAIRRKNFSPNKSSRICSKHFTEDSFVQGAKSRTLKPDAVPTIFDFNAKTTKPKKHSAKKSFNSFNSESSIEQVYNVEEASEKFFPASDNACEVDSTQVSLGSLENENHVLRLTIQHLSRKIERFDCLTTLLATKELISEEAAIILKSAIEKHNFSNSSS